MRTTLLSSLAILAGGALAAPAPHVVHEKREIAGSRWTKYERVHPEALLPVRIGLVQTNLDRGHDHLMDVSNPFSENYGKWLSVEDVHDMFAPASEAVDAVRSWLESAGVEAHRISQSANKQWMQFDAPTAELEDLINTKFHHFESEVTGKTSIACDEYHVPAHVSKHIDYITPGIKHMDTKSAPKTVGKRNFGYSNGHVSLPPLFAPLALSIESILAGLASNCDTTVTPACIRQFYNITAPTKNVTGNDMGVFEDLGDVYSQGDLNLFFALAGTKIPQGTHPYLEGVDGGQAPAVFPQAAGAESDLDFQISYPIIYPQGEVLFQTDDPVYEANYTYEGFFNNFLDAIDGSYCSPADETLDPPYPNPAAGGFKGQKQCGVYKPTNVISISYGGQEFDLPTSYQTRQCAEWMKLGLQGVSVVLSSGDSGVSGPAGDDNANGCLGTGQIFSPDFPAGCPYITTVGATYLPKGASAASDSEVAVTRFPSGGGFSNIFPQASYQTSAVQSYFKTAGTQYPYYNKSGNADPTAYAGKGIYNIGGRGYPDISAVGDNVLIYNGGLPTLIGGTSASAPVWGAILTRINGERLSAGKGTIGFVNPTLYAHPEVLHDITVGSNPGCNTTGFAVSKGWDPVTGLGTPNYPALLKLFMSL